MSNKNLGNSAQSFGSKVRDISKRPENTPGGFLSRVFFAVLQRRTNTNLERMQDHRTFLERWNALVIAYLRDPRNSIPQTNNALTSARGNLSKEILKPSMTWKVWVKSMRLLQVVKIDFHLRFHCYKREHIEHTMSMNLGDHYVDEDFEDDLLKPLAEEDLKVPEATVLSEASHIPASSIPDNILG